MTAEGRRLADTGHHTHGETLKRLLSLSAPMLIIHGTADNPSPIAEIYQYATDLTDAGKDFELKVYSGEPHGFMLDEGELRQDEVARDAFNQMVSW